MQARFIPIFMATMGLLLSTSVSFAEDGDADSSHGSYGKAKADPQNAKDLDAKRKAAAKIKLIDINSAKKEELKKLPGIGDVEADKIIAGRPFGSKVWLETHNIVSMEVYEKLKQRVIAKQPFKESEKNAALYAPKK